MVLIACFKNLLKKALLVASAAAFVALPSTPMMAAVDNLLPTPQSVAIVADGLSTPLTQVTLSMPAFQEDWLDWLKQNDVNVAMSGPVAITGRIVDEIPGVEAPDSACASEAYRLAVLPHKIEVEALSPRGIYWALQTLSQLADKDGNTVTVPQCTIVDWPAFSWRGFMMDVGRSYISMEELKREIRLLSQFKVNVYHWHLTENQAWRLQSLLYPMLNDTSVTERDKGKYYTLDQAREIVDYAHAHNMKLLPEIDMPGHSAVFQRTFNTDMQTPEGMAILKELIDEVCQTFDTEYLHIGTDEVKFVNMDFVPEMVAFVRQRGKKAMSWHPGWKYQPGEIDAIQMWSYRGRPLANTPSIESRLHYINHFDTFADIVALYRSNIAGATQANDSIAGVEVAVWNDRLVIPEESQISQNNLYPSMLAMAERAWIGGGDEYFDVRGTNLIPSDTTDFNAFVDFERRLLWHKDNTLAEVYIPYVKQTNVKWNITDAFPNQGDLTRVFPPETDGLLESYTYADSVYNVNEATGAGIYLRHVWGPGTVKGFYPDPNPNHTAYAYTWVYSPIDQTVGALIETQNYSRSESDMAPPAGKWDYRESRIWINDEEILPPVWTSTLTDHRDNEVPLGNENFSAREPTAVDLHQGWNKVLLKLPIGQFSIPQVRINKWMFTLVFTTPDGSQAAPGLIYSPSKTL